MPFLCFTSAGSGEKQNNKMAENRCWRSGLRENQQTNRIFYIRYIYGRNFITNTNSPLQVARKTQIALSRRIFPVLSLCLILNKEIAHKRNKKHLLLEEKLKKKNVFHTIRDEKIFPGGNPLLRTTKLLIVFNKPWWFRPKDLWISLNLNEKR